jgi:subtilisin family serine protease
MTATSIRGSFAFIVTLVLLLMGCDSKEFRTLTNSSGLGIVRRPEPYSFGRGQLQSMPDYNPASQNALQIDLRSWDLSALDLSGRGNDLSYAVFDSKTRWPVALPPDFSPPDILETGKNPGLGLRSLHERGVTGKGIGIAIIDQPLLVDHVEYADRLKCYEEIHWRADDTVASMHGPAVASLAVGKTVGVAPEADLYFIAEDAFWGDAQSNWDFTWAAQSIDRVLELNQLLPAGNKIRVISMSFGWNEKQKGYVEVTAAVARAVQAGIFVISSSLNQTYGYFLQGLGRAPTADPDRPESYGVGVFWANDYYAHADAYPKDGLLVPMDSRAAASFTGDNDYLWGGIGGWSWVIPYLAGVYALACQVQPDVTPDVFWRAALKTGTTMTVTSAGIDYQPGKILDPGKLMDELSK